MSILNNAIRSKYPYASTNIYNVTASLSDDFYKLNIFEKIQEARKFIFVFDYPTPENIDVKTYKDYFETLFISNYIDDYFKFETFERWQVAFYSKTLEVLPTYNAMLSNFFYEDKEKLFFNKTKTTNSQTRNSDRKNKNINSSFPANLNKAGLNVDNVEYGKDGSITNEKDEDIITGETQTETGNTFEMSMKFDEHYKDIFKRLLAEFKPLFSSLIYF